MAQQRDDVHLSPVPKFDMYGPIHKALRRDLGDILADLGTTSFETAQACEGTLDRLEALLHFADQHIEHEDRFLRPALEARLPGSCEGTDEEHAEHAREVAHVRQLAVAVRSANDDTRPVLGRSLYLMTSRFVASTLEHMLLEENQMQQLLDRLFSVEEQVALHEQILRSLPPDEMAESMTRMLPAMSATERAGLYAGARAGMPAEVFTAFLGLGRKVLPEQDFADLCRRLDVVQAA